MTIGPDGHSPKTKWQTWVIPQFPSCDSGQVGTTSGGSGSLEIAGGTVDFCTANDRGLSVGDKARIGKLGIVVIVK